MLFPKVLRADILEHATHIGRQLRLDAFIGKVSGKLRTVTVHGSPITSREWLIEFICKDGRKLNDLRLDNTR